MTTYAVNRKTKEHRIAKPGESWAHPWQLLSADKDGWIEWHPPKRGAECPLPNRSPVEVLLVRGHRHQGKALDFPWFDTEDGGTVEFYRPILDAKPEPPEWDGESWPPPVGTVVESRDDTGVSHAEVIAIRGGKVIGCCVKNHLAGWLMEEDWSPIRSEEDRVVEEMASVFCDGFNLDTSPRDIAQAFYRAGYRKHDD